MKRWSALALLLAIAVALALRIPRLDTRPLHNDEAVNAVKVSELWQHGRYVYDPDEYHGPTLHYATLPFLWLSGARNPGELNDTTLRLAPVAFGVGLLLLFLLFVDGVGRGAVMWAALFTAASPAMVFYSRYFIHEMLLVFFTALTVGAGWRYFRARWSHLSLSPQQGKISPNCNLRSEPPNQAGAPPPAPFSPQRGEGLGMRGGSTSDREEVHGEESHWHHHPSTSLPPPGERRRKPVAAWAILTGIGLGLMITTKETFVLTLAAMGLAGIITAWWTLPAGNKIRRFCDFWNWRDASLALAAAALIWLLLFSSFFTNFAGPLDSIRTYLPWLKRAGGHSPHIHPWSFYLERLAWFHPARGPVWSEGLILGLTVIGMIVSFTKKSSPLLRFLMLYTVFLTAIYSVISYKTPWCLLNFFLGMILLAGVGAATLVGRFRARALQGFVVTVLIAFTVQLSWQAWRASITAWDTSRSAVKDRQNPYVYAQTVPDILNLVQRADGIARVSPDGYDTVVKVIAPESDYWPLPWYLRRFNHLGWYDKLPDDPFAPIVIAASKLDARLDEKSDRKWIMVGLTELRPGRFFEQYVELELWKKYVETLPRERD